jgi:hypothetical protein
MKKKIRQKLKCFKKKLERFALKHNINPKIFFRLWLVAFIIKILATALGIAGTLTLNHNVHLIFIVLNRIVAALIPIYVIFWGRKLHWSIRPLYIIFFFTGTFGLEKFFSFFK